MTIEQVCSLIQEVKNFPRDGVNFKDMTPVLEDAKAFRSLTRHMAERVHPQTEKIVAIESRGFILGAAVAQHLSCGLVLARKPGKLPRATEKETYDLEYGSDSLEIHKGALRPGEKVTIIDDVLATGGTAGAAERLCSKFGAEVLGSVFFIEIPGLGGRQRLFSPVESLSH